MGRLFSFNNHLDDVGRVDSAEADVPLGDPGHDDVRDASAGRRAGRGSHVPRARDAVRHHVEARSGVRLSPASADKNLFKDL